jgi:hypothetical protein
LPQAPQLFGSVWVFVSQPFIWTVPLQFANPAAQCAWQTPPAQEGMVLVVLHTTPHPPQLRVSVCVFVEHPVIPPQLAKPGIHMDAVHTPMLQDVPIGHILPHAPQLLLSVWTFASHPSAGLPLQSAKPGLQLRKQFPPLQ